MELVKFNNGVVTASSKEIADTFGKSHRNVTQAIENMNCSDEFRDANFQQSYYTSEQNKKLKCFEVTRDGFSFLCMGFGGKKAAKWKESYITAFNVMESHIVKSDTVMDQINAALLLMETDSKSASLCSHGLNKWKKIKRKHEKEVERLVSQSQLFLNLS